MLRIISILICSGMLLVNFSTDGLVNAQSVDEFVEALTPKSTTQKYRENRGLGGVKSGKQNLRQR